MTVCQRPVVDSGTSGTVLAGGVALIGGALAFLGVFTYLAARFQYPEVFDGRAQDVLPALLATGAYGRTAWAIYSVLPVCCGLRERPVGSVGGGWPRAGWG